MSSTLTVILIAANVTVAVAALGRAILRSERSLFRYRTWQIRDDLVDAMLDGRLKPHKRLFEYVDRLEVTIEATEIITPFALLSASRILRRAGQRPVDEEPYLGTSDEERAIIEDGRQRTAQARVRLLVFGSPSGWLLLLISPLVTPWIVWRDRRAEHTKAPPLATVAHWSNERYGSTAEIVRPMVRPKGARPEERRPAYV